MLAWPGLDPIATLDLAGLDSDQDRFDFFGCLLSQDHIILTTIPNHHLLLCTADLHPEAWIDLDLTDGAEPEAVLGLAPDALALELWDTDSTDPPAATVWQIPDLAPPHQRTTMI